MIVKDVVLVAGPCRASRDGNGASDPPGHGKPDSGGAVWMIA
jgi:hypothetical protein